MRKEIKHIVIVLAIIFITKALGLFRDAIIPHQFGVNNLTDGYFIGLSLVLTLYALIGKAMILHLIPLFKGTDQDYGVLKHFVVRSSLVAFALIGAYGILDLYFIRLLYTGQPQAIQAFVTTAVYALGGVPFLYGLVAFHQAREHFYLTHFIGLVFNACIITIALFNQVVVLQWSFVIGILLQIIILVSFKFNIAHFVSHSINKVKTSGHLALVSIALLLAYEQVNVMIDRRFMGQFGQGQITLLDLASKLSFLFMGILVMGVTTVVYPRFVKHHQEGDDQKLKQTSRVMLGVFSFLSLLAIGGLVVFGKWGIHLIYGQAPIDQASLYNIMVLYALALLPLSMREVVLRLMIIRNQTRYATWATGLALVLNALLSAVAKTPLQVLTATLITIYLHTLIIFMVYHWQTRSHQHENI